MIDRSQYDHFHACIEQFKRVKRKKNMNSHKRKKNCVENIVCWK